MTDEVARLVREIERVVTASYVPSLQDLYGLAQGASPYAIKCWAMQKPCQVGLLVDVLVDGLPRSRVALPLLSLFAAASTFQNALLSRYPVILDAFLEKAIDGGEREYHLACIALLSSSLPPGTVPPARLASFITMLVSAMAANPGAETLIPLHTIINGLHGSCQILNDVPVEVMSNLQLELTKTLRNLDDHMGNLLCLATFAQIASTKNDNDSNQHEPNAPSWLVNIQQFFGPKRGLKTLDLVVLRVILACSSNRSNLTGVQAAESIRLAICVADTIQPQQKQIWVSGNRAKIAKLCDKVAREGLDRELQMMGVAFLFSILPATDLPCHIRELGLHALVSKGSRGTMGIMPQYLIPRMAKTLAYSDESAIYHLLRFAFETLKEGSLSNWTTLSDLHLANLILSGFHQVEPAALASALTGSVSTKNAIINLLGMFPVKPSQDQCDETDTCYCEKIALQNKVLVNLFELYFAVVLSRDGDNKDILIMKGFVERVANSFTTGNCKFLTAYQKDLYGNFCLRQRQGFTPTGTLNRDWRSEVTNDFMQYAQNTQSSMMKRIEEVCSDLERRCYDVETPLRAAQEECDKHLSEANHLRGLNEELRRQLEESLQSITQAQQEITHLEERAENTSSHVEELSVALNTTQQKLQEQKCEFEERIQGEQERARTRELDFIATSTEKDDQLEELQDELHRLQAENLEIQQTVDAVSREQTNSLNASSSLKHELLETQKAFEATKLLCTQKEAEVKGLLAKKEDMQMEIGKLKAMVTNPLSEKLEENSRSEMVSLKQKHDTENAQAVLEIERQKEENQRLHATMQDAARDASKELQFKDKRIHHLEKKIQSLRDERAAKAREFSEAQQHIGRLMNVMGFSAQPIEPIGPSAASKHQNTRRDGPQHPKNARHSAAYEEDDGIQLAESFDTMANIHGRTPKRPKGNQRSITESQRPPPETASTPVLSPSYPHVVHPKQPCPRQPLRETSPNSPTKSQSTHPFKPSNLDSHHGKRPDENHFQDIDLDMDLEFSRDFIFTSTAFSESNDQMAP
ncbi:uncharacterized protein N7459_000504 [Penicillium hispanicum]|uniref:uncharacterized protein n=1 Tax=Penicillium hispanicum TaxID=1080232 RepID=UPI00253FAD92|nr:uncharacterized protein N7459_000504 [Penicillium hispanicum]KAJ5594296.1 hypothetical protein N7459_000504 [Penicillium hispanicum]